MCACREAGCGCGSAAAERHAAAPRLPARSLPRRPAAGLCAAIPPETTPELLLIDKAAGCFLRAPRAFYVSERARLRGWSGLFEGIIKYRHCRQGIPVPSYWPEIAKKVATRSTQKPDVWLQLEHVFGYNVSCVMLSRFEEFEVCCCINTWFGLS